MPPTSNIWGACRSIAIRSRRPVCQSQRPAIAAIARQLSTDPGAPRPNGIPNIPGVEGSLAAGRPTPPSPEDSIREEDVQMREPTPGELALSQLELTAIGLNPFGGFKFGEPEVPVGKLHETKFHMKHRYEEGIIQLTKLLMRDGKLSKAQRDMAMILNYLRTSPPPKLNPQRPLLAGSPPPEHLPLNPNLYLMLAIDSVAPLIRIRGFTGLAGGGKALEVPVPMSRRARRRTAFSWIMDVVEKKTSMGSGRKMLAHRIAEEIVAVVEGRSTVWDKRNNVHKTGTSVRANLTSPALLKRKV
ncbi:hypothetical protein KVR01_000689 [Diaporthe batatas]|uniref:mitochondrial 37S ribosomal protein RSM7 n=1 Tax=Diaporthe batatas TaxID=748121 RepID=UPI001D058598|nr:mitochondrial 37S ribosomal protein RSM7 [Diaporthe batatas]KAG8169944.1 hypothetical protein KVR01_000689 [Diaporthe batatas]